MKPERFTAVVFVFVIGALMMTAVSCFVSRKAGKITDDTKREIKIDWEKLYPFENVTGKAAVKESRLVKLYQHVKKRLQRYTAEELPGYYRLVEGAKRYEDAVGWNMESVFAYNGVIRLKDGYLTTYVPSRDVAPDAEAVKEFANFCAERGIDFAYINFPTKVSKSEDREISGVLDFSNQNADRFLAMLDGFGVRNYDFRENLRFSTRGGGVRIVMRLSSSPIITGSLRRDYGLRARS